jgi:hypothetical protein
MHHRRFPPPEAIGGQKAPHTEGGLATAQHRNLSEAIRNACTSVYCGSKQKGGRGERYLCLKSLFRRQSEGDCKFQKTQLASIAKNWRALVCEPSCFNRFHLGSALAVSFDRNSEDSFQPRRTSGLLGGRFACSESQDDLVAPLLTRNLLRAVRKLARIGKCEAIGEVSPGIAEIAAISR